MGRGGRKKTELLPSAEAVAQLLGLHRVGPEGPSHVWEL